MMATWLAMAAAEVDGYRSNAYAKYSKEERATMREVFYQKYFKQEVMWHGPENDDPDVEVSYPPLSLESPSLESPSLCLCLRLSLSLSVCLSLSLGVCVRVCVCVCGHK